MPTFEYKTNKGTFVINSNRELTPNELDSHIQTLDSTETPRKEIRNPALAALKSASDLIGGPFATQYYVQRAKGLNHGQAMKRAAEIAEPIEKAKVKGVPAQIAFGAVQAAPLLAGVANPFMAGAGRATQLASKIPLVGRVLGSGTARSALGFGGFETAKELATGQISTPEQAKETFKQGAISGGLFHAGGRLGSTAAQPLRGLTQQASRIGSAAGGAGVAAAMAPEGERTSSGIIGGSFGAKFPSRPLGQQPSLKLRQRATNIYKDILKPSKGEIKKIEIRQRGKIDKFYKLAAEERLTIHKDSQNKIDTTEARGKIKEKIENKSSQLDQILDLDKISRFNLSDIGKRAKIEAQKTIKNAKDLEVAKNEIDSEIISEINRHGTFTVTAKQLNNIKQGMWSKSFRPLEPSSKTNARRIGSVIKETIENSYPNKDIKSLNRETGDLLTLNTLLENSHGRVVAGGRIGGHTARVLGAIAGATIGKVPLVGPFTVIGGSAIGEQLSRRVNDHTGRTEYRTGLNPGCPAEQVPVLRAAEAGD